MGFRKIWTNFQRDLKVRDRIVEYLLFCQQHCQLIMHLGISRPPAHCLLIAICRPFQISVGRQNTPQLGIGDAKIALHLFVIRLKAERIAKALHSLCRLALLQEHRPQKIRGAGVARKKLNGPAQCGLSICELTLGLTSHAKIAPGIGVGEIRTHDLPVEPLGLGKGTFVMAVPSESEDFRNGGHGK